MPSSDIIDYLIQVAGLGGSDLHISADAYPTARVHNQLIPLSGEKLSAHDCRQLILSTLKETQRTKLEQDWELDFALSIDGVGRFRGNACFAGGHIEASFRHIPKEIPGILELGHSAAVDQLCMAKSGLLLISGIGGAGKTTTLASMIKKLASQGNRMILTIEDPIEHVFPHFHGIVRQRQVGTDTQSFSQALRGALRLGADVLVIGELRDLETMRIALAAAETGHLVISTLHTTTAAGAISRIVDAFPEEGQDYVCAQLSHVLVGVVCQHLIPRTDKPGRCLATEVMVNNSAVAACIRGHRFGQLNTLLEIGTKDGMHTLDDSLIHLALNHKISGDDAMLRAKNPSQLHHNLQSAILANQQDWFANTQKL